MTTATSAGRTEALPPPGVQESPGRVYLWIAAAALMAAAMFLLARYVGLGLAGGPWAYWPTHGILVGILFRRPTRQWPAIGAAAVGAQVLTIYLVRGDVAGGATIVGATAGLVQAVLIVWILRRISPGGFVLDRPRDLAWFVAIAVTLVPLLVTPFSALGYTLAFRLPYAAVWGPLFVGNSLSLLLFAPPFMNGHHRSREAVTWDARPAEVALCQAAILALALVAFAGPDHWVRFIALPYATFPLLAWSALRCGPRWTAMAVVAVATVAAWCTARGMGPFGGSTLALGQRVLALQVFLAFVAFTALLLVALTGERLRSYAAISLQDSIQRAFFDSAVTVLILKDLEGRYLMLNQAAEAVHGRPAAELLGRHPRAFLPPEDVELIETHDRRARERGEPVLFDETFTVQGARRQLVVTRFPVRDHRGVTRYMGMIGRDETMERDLSRRLQGAQRVEILGRLAAGVAHDLNNLLTVMVGNTELLREGAVMAAADLEALREMSSAGAQATKLTRRLMSLGRNPPAAPGAVSVDAVLRELEPLLRALVRGNVELALDAPAARVAADPMAVEQIVLNLVSNGRDAIEGDGRIGISTAVVERDGRPWLRLRVADSGTGMTSDTLGRIFEPFFTTKEEARGTGLGLYTIAALVRQSGGDISAASEPGAGTTFTVDLPVDPGQA